MYLIFADPWTKKEDSKDVTDTQKNTDNLEVKSCPFTSSKISKNMSDDQSILLEDTKKNS